jgi:hypothetical protein
MVESMIAGNEGIIREVRSPLPRLFVEFGDNPVYFLEASRLMCVLYLILTRTVEHIFQLDLSMGQGDTVRVRFEGQRSPRYANEDPHTIKFEGVCSLR